jgi:hypothetical protein
MFVHSFSRQGFILEVVRFWLVSAQAEKGSIFMLYVVVKIHVWGFNSMVCIVHDVMLVELILITSILHEFLPESHF